MITIYRGQYVQVTQQQPAPDLGRSTLTIGGLACELTGPPALIQRAMQAILKAFEPEMSAAVAASGPDAAETIARELQASACAMRQQEPDEARAEVEGLRLALAHLQAENAALRQPCTHTPGSEPTCPWCRAREAFRVNVVFWHKPMHEDEALAAFDAAVQAVREGK